MKMSLLDIYLKCLASLLLLVSVDPTEGRDFCLINLKLICLWRPLQSKIVIAVPYILLNSNILLHLLTVRGLRPVLRVTNVY